MIGDILASIWAEIIFTIRIQLGEMYRFLYCSQRQIDFFYEDLKLLLVFSFYYPCDDVAFQSTPWLFVHIDEPRDRVLTLPPVV